MSVTWRWVESGRMLYISGAAETSREVLERLDRLMADARIGKPNLLTARITLSDMSLLDEHEAAWNDWVDPRWIPLTVLRTGKPPRPVEILLTAAK